MEPVNKDQYLLQSLDNALGVLSLFLQEDKLTLSQIAQRSGLNKTVAYRIVYTLEKRGYLNADREGRYRPGIQLAALGARAQMSRAAVELTKPVLTALSREINETIHFTRRYDACRATLLDEILPQQGLIAASSPTRSLLLLHLCCTGLAILSTQTDEDIRDYCDAVVFEKRSCPFILSSSQLMEKIAAVRREGYMLNDQMYEPGVAALGVPIFALGGGFSYVFQPTFGFLLGLIPAAAQRYGDQCVVLSADIKRVDGKFMLFAKGGRENTGIDALDWLEQGVKNGAGELVVNSIDTDGVKNGFDLELLDAVAQRCAVPIIASGGAGKMDDFKELFLNHPRVDAGLAASIFHTKQVDIRDLKLYLRENGVEMRV